MMYGPRHHSMRMPSINNNANSLQLQIDGAHQEVHDEMLNRGLPFIVAVFADWCGHCNRLTQAQPGNKVSEWDKFLNSSPKYLGDTPIIWMDYDVMSKLAGNKECEFGRMLAASASSFPFISVAKKDTLNNKISVHVYDGTYPMTASSIRAFLQS